MEFFTIAQIRAIADFRPKEVDYVVIGKALHNPGSIVVTFWMLSDHYVNFLITPEGELKSV